MMKLKTSALIVLAGLSLGVTAQAQNGQGGPGGQGGQGGGRRGGNRGGAQMTPLQMQRMRDEMMKTQMTALGVPEASQTAIIAYAAARETATMPLRAQARTLQQGLANNLSAEAATRQLSAMRDAVKIEKTRRETAQKDLDTAVGFSKNPQLEAYLTLAGLIGDEGAILAPPGAGAGRGGPGGGNRRGGGQGGGRGGQGGFGGGQGGDDAPPMDGGPAPA